jgi:hypothetical protein
VHVPVSAAAAAMAILVFAEAVHGDPAVLLEDVPVAEVVDSDATEEEDEAAAQSAAATATGSRASAHAQLQQEAEGASAQSAGSDEEGASAQSAGSDEDPWVCSECTLQNHGAMERCETCRAWRGSAADNCAIGYSRRQVLAVEPEPGAEREMFWLCQVTADTRRGADMVRVQWFERAQVADQPPHAEHSSRPTKRQRKQPERLVPSGLQQPAAGARIAPVNHEHFTRGKHQAGGGVGTRFVICRVRDAYDEAAQTLALSGEELAAIREALKHRALDEGGGGGGDGNQAGDAASLDGSRAGTHAGTAVVAAAEAVASRAYTYRRGAVLALRAPREDPHTFWLCQVTADYRARGRVDSAKMQVQWFERRDEDTDAQFVRGELQLGGVPTETVLCFVRSASLPAAAATSAGGESGDELVLTRAEQAKISNAVEKDRRGGGVVRANSSKPASVQLCLHRPVDDSSRSAAAEEARAPRSCTKATTARGPKKRKAKAAVSKQQPSLMKIFKPMGT